MPRQSAAKQDRAAGVSGHPAVVPRAPWRVAEVEALDGWRLRVRHNDGVNGLVDMNALVHSERAGMFAALRDEGVFRQVFLDLGAVAWPGEVDLSPYAMHEAIADTGEWILN